jgi:hypothetical protein
MTERAAQIKTIKISADQIERAKQLYTFTKLKGSITDGESNIFGALGEVVVYDYFKGRGFSVDFKSTFDYDLLIGGYRVDVKTKKTTVIPRNNYFCSIAAYNTRQNCDFYFFLRINERFDVCYLLGYIRKADFFNKATFNRKGDIDKNGWTFKADCYNLQISMLAKFK